MLINLPRFRELMKKSTLNNSIDSVMFNVDSDSISSNMKSTNKDVFTIINVPNDEIITDVKDGFSLPFAEPKTNVEPFLNLIEDDEVELKVKDNYIVLGNSVKLFFEDPSVISSFGGKDIQNSVEFFAEMDINEEFVNNFKKIKKVGSKFSKIYFIVENSKLHIETTDKTNSFSNSLKFDIGVECSKNDLVLCFDYRNIVNLMNVLDYNHNKKQYSNNYASLSSYEYLTVDDKADIVEIDGVQYLRVQCAYCGEYYFPNNKEVMTRINSLNGKAKERNKLYCSQQCKDNSNFAQYKLKFTYFDEQELGGVYCVKEDETEKYFLTSFKE